MDVDELQEKRRVRLENDAPEIRKGGTGAQTISEGARPLVAIDFEVLGFAKRLHGALQGELRKGNALEGECRVNFRETHPTPRREQRKDLDEEKRLRNVFGLVGHEDSRNFCREGRKAVRVGGGLGKPPTHRLRRFIRRRLQGVRRHWDRPNLRTPSRESSAGARRLWNIRTRRERAPCRRGGER